MQYFPSTHNIYQTLIRFDQLFTLFFFAVYFKFFYVENLSIMYFLCKLNLCLESD